MKERKFVKLRIDMYEDTKFKIIDTKPERDLIHYIWTRLLTLAGKVNLAGELYLSKNIQYTVETLAIEFNRSAMEVKLALKMFLPVLFLLGWCSFWVFRDECKKYFFYLHRQNELNLFPCLAV